MTPPRINPWRRPRVPPPEHPLVAQTPSAPPPAPPPPPVPAKPDPVIKAKRGRPPKRSEPDPEDEGEEAELPALDLRQSLIEEASEPSDAVKALGAPLAGVRSAAEWGYHLAMTQAYEAANDATVSQARREQRVWRALAAAAKMYPEALRQEAAREIRASRLPMEQKKNRRAVAKSVPLALEEGANVIQFRGTRG